MNNTIIIPFSKKKMVKLLGLYILVMLGIAAIIFFILSADSINLFYLMLFIVLFIAGTYLFYKHIQELWSSNKNEALILTPEYLKSNVTPLGKRVGEIAWSEIASIEKANYYGQHIYIKLKHPEKYVNRLKGMSKDFTGIYLNDSELEISFEELEKLIHEYFQKYR